LNDGELTVANSTLSVILPRVATAEIAALAIMAAAAAV